MAGSRLYAIETDGLKETVAGLDRLERLDVTRDLKDAFEAMAKDAASRARGNASTRMQRAAADTISTVRSSLGATLSFGAGFGGAFGAEFGGAQNQRRVVNHFGYYTGWNQFDHWKGSGLDAGYFLWPGIREAALEGRDALADALEKIFDKGGS